MIRPGITLPADAYIHDRRDELVIRTTVGRDRDEKYAAGTFIRAAGVTGANVAATGGTQFLATLDPVDIRFGGSRLRRKPDDMREGRRKGHAEMWHAHAGDKLKPSAANSQLGRVSSHDGPLAPWHGQPQRHWMQKGREVDKSKRSGLLSLRMQIPLAPHAHQRQRSLQKTQLQHEESYLSAKLQCKDRESITHDLERLDALRVLSRDAAKARKEPPPKPGTPAESRERVGISRGGMAWWLKVARKRCSHTPKVSGGNERL